MLGLSKRCGLMTKIFGVIGKVLAGIDFLEGLLMVLYPPVVQPPYLFCSPSSGADTL
jgi:hypothetical protein